ncbi:MAG: ATP-binding protein [Clostridium sp.]|nr:ATP-binding protein [Bacteroides sp.]MCM1198262.1 ATP-binding protein [Clostridium sp.]
MLKRKVISQIEEYFHSGSNKMLIVDGARQIGKTFIIRHVGERMFKNYIEINMERDKQSDGLFAEATSVEKFYLALSAVAGEKMGDRESTLVFIDEIQAYDHLLTLVKFLMEDRRFTYIASGSLLGVTLKKTQSIPIGSMMRLHMYPLDFEEFLWANGVGEIAIAEMRSCFENKVSLQDSIHGKIMDLFRTYLLVGGLPDAVNTYIAEHNIVKVRSVHSEIHSLYGVDAAKYERESGRKLKIQRIYSMVPSNLENRKKRVVVKDIEGKAGKRTGDYQDEFDYLVASGIALEVDAISLPSYPLKQNAGKKLLKLYMNDTGLFTGLLYNNNIKPVLDDIAGINLGAVYENVVAQELKAHGFPLYYYDNKKNGEVDFLIDDTEKMTAVPLEIKSGKDYKVHSALDRFISVPDYNIRSAYVLSNEQRVFEEKGIWYIPVYYVMFFKYDTEPDSYVF